MKQQIIIEIDDTDIAITEVHITAPGYPLYIDPTLEPKLLAFLKEISPKPTLFVWEQGAPQFGDVSHSVKDIAQ